MIRKLFRDNDVGILETSVKEDEGSLHRMLRPSGSNQSRMALIQIMYERRESL